jgi:hypothetical protein
LRAQGALVITHDEEGGVIPLGEVEHNFPLGESLFDEEEETDPVCHGLLHDPNFLDLLLRADEELAEETRAAGCACGGVLHRADYPRKPRGCLSALREEFSSRFSFCCATCRKRTTARSMRFFGRRVYLALAVVLLSTRAIAVSAAGIASALQVPRRTLARWRTWWREQLPLTALWRATSARFLPPVDTVALPDSLLARFVDGAPDSATALQRLLRYLTPLTVTRASALGEGC